MIIKRFINSIVVLLVVFLLGTAFSISLFGTLYAIDEQPEQTTETENLIPIKPTAKPSKELVVFSFYDTQLQVMCYMSTFAIQCIVRDSLSDRAKTFIDDRVVKQKDKMPGILLPRIVPLDK